MLQKVKFAPGFNKQVTSTGGESQWVDGDNVRFRYGTPEKIGGWSQLGSVQITGRATAIHHFVNTSGINGASVGFGTGGFSWGRLSGFTRGLNPISIGVTGLTIDSGLSTYPTIQRRDFGLRDTGSLRKDLG